MKLGIWRRSPSLGLHETTFRENTIDEIVLPDLILMMRLYWPKETPPSILPPGEGTWQPPGVVRVS